MSETVPNSEAIKLEKTKLATPAGINALVVDANANRRAATQRILGRLGYCVADHGASLAEIDVGEHKSGIGVIIIGATSTTSHLIEEVRALRARLSVPILVLSEDADTDHINDAVNAGVNAYVVIGVNGNRIKAGIDLARANHRAMRELEHDAASAREALEARKIIEKAKGIVMKSKGLDEATAYSMLQKTAMKRGTRLIDVARTLTDAVDLLE